MTSHSIVTSPIWTAAGWTMLHLVWVGAAGGLVLALLRRLLRPVRPEVRHGVAVACLLALAASPYVLFAWLYQPDRALQTSSTQARDSAPLAEQATAQIAPLSALKRQLPAVEPAGVGSTAPISSRFAPLVGYLPGVWLTGSLATLALLATGLIGVEQLRRSSVLLETGAIAQCCRELAASLGVARDVGVAVCDQLVAPVLIGVLRPLILLPPAALSGWSIEQVEMALLHELAHIRRRDNLVTFVQRLAESLLFFHPVTWWLSAWISLERELCCDRLVVERTGRPQAYARMLAALAGAGPGANLPALAMAERPLTTRIRRILDMEDRSMKLTLTEGLGLLVATIVGMTLTLATHAAPPTAKDGPADVARRSLERMAANVVALPEPASQEGSEGKSMTLFSIAQAQLKLGDRAGTLTTLGYLDRLAAPRPAKPGGKMDLRVWQRFAALAQSIELRRDAGDLDGARARLGQTAQELKVLDNGVVRGAFERVSTEMDREVTKKAEGLRRLNDEEAGYVCQVSALLIEQCLAIGDKPMALKLIHRVIDALGPPQGPTKAVLVGVLGRYLEKAGDREGGRALIDQSRRASLALTDPNVKAFVLSQLARLLFEAGDRDEALALIRELPPRTQQSTLSTLINELSIDDRRVPWLDVTGINLKIGDSSLSPKDPAQARELLPKIAAVARATGDARVQARTLATIALLQARSGDFAVALATAESIPDLKRADYPGPSDGFYDAVKPATFALIGGIMAESGDQSAATDAFARSETLTRAVGAEDQKLIAQIVIVQQQIASGRTDAAKAVIHEALPQALAQPEPRRSRVLLMLAESQVKAGDTTAALRTVDDIRDYPGIEKARALAGLVRQHEDSGDTVTSKALANRAIACLKAKALDTPLPGQVMTTQAFNRETFIDFDLEFNLGMLNNQRDMQLRSLQAGHSDVEMLVREVKALLPAERNLALSQLVPSLVRRGDITGAMDLATSIESPDARMQAFTLLAYAISQPQAKK
ncbi:M56 family metallopeptidase [Singulisphaera sp. Ch08]|uniref:M56 family metallopeptidase n=1 Tax=Singulisphaera sp. Ch08 TaxID=3120278 RepID=A0AAU7C8D6_9BACT